MPEPRPTVRLVGMDGNAFYILGIVTQALIKAGATKGHIEKYQHDATQGDYNHLLTITSEYVEIE